MNEYGTREMTFMEISKSFLKEIDGVGFVIPEGQGLPEEQRLLNMSVQCVNKAITEIKTLEERYEKTHQERDLYRCELDRLKMEHEIVVKSLCKLIR